MIDTKFRAVVDWDGLACQLSDGAELVVVMRGDLAAILTFASRKGKPFSPPIGRSWKS